MPDNQLHAYAVWDAPTRWFHWVNVLCVVGLMGVGLAIFFAKELGVPSSGKILLKTTHVWIGYVFATNLAVRLVWAFIGNRYARWRMILPGGSGYVGRCLSYMRSITSAQPQHYLGHNPLGRIAVAVLFVLLLSQAVTGLVLAGTDIFYPPFGHWIAEWIAAPGVAPDTLVPYAPEMTAPNAVEAMRAFRQPFITVHYYGFFALLIVIVAHIVAVIFTEKHEGGALVSAMFTGTKMLSGKPVDDEDR